MARAPQERPPQGEAVHCKEEVQLEQLGATRESRNSLQLEKVPAQQ